MSDTCVNIAWASFQSVVSVSASWRVSLRSISIWIVLVTINIFIYKEELESLPRGPARMPRHQLVLCWCNTCPYLAKRYASLSFHTGFFVFGQDGPWYNRDSHVNYTQRRYPANPNDLFCSSDFDFGGWRSIVLNLPIMELDFNGINTDAKYEPFNALFPSAKSLL